MPYDGTYDSVVGEVVGAKRMIIHPNFRNRSLPSYNDDKMQYDYCLVEVEEINFNRLNFDEIRVESTTLSETHVEPSIVVAGQTAVPMVCNVVGWGVV